jgi:hypothetical protein
MFGGAAAALDSRRGADFMPVSCHRHASRRRIGYGPPRRGEVLHTRDTDLIEGDLLANTVGYTHHKPTAGCRQLQYGATRNPSRDEGYRERALIHATCGTVPRPEIRIPACESTEPSSGRLTDREGSRCRSLHKDITFPAERSGRCIVLRHRERSEATQGSATWINVALLDCFSPLAKTWSRIHHRRSAIGQYGTCTTAPAQPRPCVRGGGCRIGAAAARIATASRSRGG